MRTVELLQRLREGAPLLRLSASRTPLVMLLPDALPDALVPLPETQVAEVAVVAVAAARQQ